MTIAIVGVGTVATGYGDLTPSLHASTAEGHLMIAFSNKRASSDKLAAPAGWEIIYQHPQTATNGNASEMTFYGKVAGASESAPTFTATGSSSGQVQILTVSGTGWDLSTQANILNVGASNGATTSTDIGAPSLTPDVDNCLVLYGGKYRDTGGTTSAGALSGFTEIDQNVFDSSTSILAVWNYVIQTTAGNTNPGSWAISSATTSPSTNAAIAAAIKETAATLYVPVVQPLYLGATLLSNKTGIKYLITNGHTDLDGEYIASGTTGTTDGSGNFVIPTSVSGTEGQNVTLTLYWEEGSEPVADRSITVKTTLVAA